MCSAILLLASLSLTSSLTAEELSFGTNTILVYESESGSEESQFVLRLARFNPDVVFEWESVSHQGTVHLFREAVEEGEGMTISSLFEAGVDVESDDVMTKWLPRRAYRQLLEDGGTELKLNRLKTDFQLIDERTRILIWNKEERVVSVMVLEDSKKGQWVFLKEESNPVLIEYSTPYYREKLARVSTTGKDVLRWFRILPPVR